MLVEKVDYLEESHKKLPESKKEYNLSNECRSLEDELSSFSSESSSSEMFRCKNCFKTFLSKKGLGEHVKKVHVQEHKLNLFETK